MNNFGQEALEAIDAGNNKLVVGLPWYTKRQWLATKSYCSDPKTFFNSFNEWRSEADKAIIEISNRGLDVKLLPIYIETFSGWCAYHHMQPNKSARRKFTNYLMKRER
tara:strand:- start:987 stop:1310 length:324 start_codon:yes stop_codon:yes gene_type:complete